MAKVIEVKTVTGDKAANELLKEGWELLTAMSPIKLGGSGKHGGVGESVFGLYGPGGASFVFIKREEPSRKMQTL